MGNCAASQYKNNGFNCPSWPATAKIIHLDGRLQEFSQPIKASNILSQNPNCFLCSSESMYIGAQVPRLQEDEQLKQGEIYFLMPLTKSRAPLTLQELCSLAMKASSELPLASSRNDVESRATHQGCCQVPSGFQVPARRNKSENLTSRFHKKNLFIYY